jgi:hypothetical protein
LQKLRSSAFSQGINEVFGRPRRVGDDEAEKKCVCCTGDFDIQALLLDRSKRFAE